MQYYFFFLTLWFRMKVNHSWASATLGVVYKFGGYKEKAVKEVDTSRMGHKTAFLAFISYIIKAIA